jgi:hypothetical protein
MRKRLRFPDLDPERVADEARGGCSAVVLKGEGRRWRIQFIVGLKRSMHDRDIDTKRLAERFWIGFDGETRSAGWRILWANVSESSLILHAIYRRDDLRKLDRLRKVRLSPKGNLLQEPGGVLLELEGVRFAGDRKPDDAEDVPF